MDIHELQRIGYLVLVVMMVCILYGYCFHLYRSQKTGRRDYEKYSNLALNDDINGVVLERNEKGL